MTAGDTNGLLKYSELGEADKAMFDSGAKVLSLQTKNGKAMKWLLNLNGFPVPHHLK